MNPLNIIRLELYAPLYYRQDMELKPFAYTDETDVSEESLFCFEIPPDQYLSIEPEYDRYLGDVLFRGLAVSGPAENGCELSAGTYLFAQVRDLLCREDIVWMAMEIQKDGLWEQLALTNRLYLRYLFEDGATVTQIFRPYSV
ncbi:MAG: hypothetical protein LBG87_02580 [Spirochaetaceae bacterium]|jgi:hypothetical protein|nr:hypothetical protein [Spirochaetaceae bacterium]